MFDKMRKYNSETNMFKQSLQPVQFFPSAASWKPSAQRHLDPDFALTHMWPQAMVEQGSVNISYKCSVYR